MRDKNAIKDKALIYDFGNMQRFPLTAVRDPEGLFFQTQIHPEYEYECH